MALNLPVASFKTKITSRIEATEATINLDSVLDDAGNNLSGVKGFLIDEGTSDEETIIGTVDAANSRLTTCIRGISPTDGISSVTSLKKSHRKNATIKITSHPYLLEILRVLNGTTQFDADNIMAYDANPSFTPGSNQIATIKYIDDISLNGSPDGSETTKGIFEAATSAEVAAGDDTGSTSAPTIVRPSKLAEVVQKGSYLYAVEDGSGADDAYVAALTPAIVTGTAGAVYIVKLTVANTGACTLDLGFGAIAIKKWIAGVLTDLETNDIAANYTGIFEYDGTYFVLLATSAGQLSQTQITTLIANSAYFTAPYNQPVRRSITAGEDLLAGEVVAVHSSGAVLSNMTAFESQGTAVTTNDDITGTAMKMHSGVVNGAGSIAIITGTGVTCIRIWRIAYTASSGAIASLSVKDLSEGDAGATNTFPNNHATMLTSDKMFIAYQFGAATYTIRAKIYTPSSDSEGTEVLIVSPGSTMGQQIAIMPVSASEVVILYTDSVGVKYVQCTISGTTITVGASGTLVVAANLQSVSCARQFGSSGYYLVAYHSDITSRVNYVLASYAGGVFSGTTTPAELSSTTTTAVAVSTELESLSDTKMLALSRLSTDVIAFIFTRTSGTVAVDSGTTIVSSVDSTKSVSFAKLGEKLFATFPKPSANVDYTYGQLFKIKNGYSAFELVGALNQFNTNTNAAPDTTGCGLKILPHMLLVAFPYLNGASQALRTAPWTMTTNYEQVVGVVEASVSAAASASIIVSGTTDEISGVVAGTTYYTDVSGDLTSTSSGLSTNAIRRVLIADSVTSGIVKS